MRILAEHGRFRQPSAAAIPKRALTVGRAVMPVTARAPARC